jgi:hypothetical protein
MVCWPQRLRSARRGCTEPRPFESSALHIAPSLDVAPVGVGDRIYTATAVDNIANYVDSDGQVAICYITEWCSPERPSERAVGVGGGPAYRLTMSLDMDTRPSTRGATVKGAREATKLSLEVIDKQIALELSARKMLTITP